MRYVKIYVEIRICLTAYSFYLRRGCESMERIRNLNAYQKVILIFMIAISLIFAVIYPKTISRVGYRYNDTILVPTAGNGNTVYTSKIQGKQAEFIVSDDNTVEFHYGDKSYGPYTVKEDATAIPEDNEMSGSMKGIEVLEGSKILFRGGVMDMGGYYWLHSEDGTADSMLTISYTTSDGVERDANGNPIDKMKPSVHTIYELINNPELTHKGVAMGWFGAVFICLLNAVTILFADELFRWNLAFRIRNVEHAEPSDCEIAGRYIGWTAMAIIALVLFIIGLQ